MDAVLMLLAIAGWTLAALGWIGLWGAEEQIHELRARINGR